MAFSDADFSDDDRQQLAKLEAEVLADLDANPDNSLVGAPKADDEPAPQGALENAATPQPGTQAAQPTPQPSTTQPTPQPAPQGQEPAKGNLRNALRAARHEARSERQRAEAAEARARELEEQLGVTRTPQQGQADEVLAVLEADHPDVAAVVKPLIEQVNQLTAKVAPQAPSEPAFVPQVLPAELQDTIDSTDGLEDLEVWRTSKDMQEHWQAAKAADALLTTLPAWKDKPAAERLAEVIRRVNADMGTPGTTPAPQPDPKALAAQRIAQAKAPGIETLSDLRGGVHPSTNLTPDYNKMSDDEIIASL